MTQEEAKEIAARHEAKHDLVIVQSDGVVYLDPDYNSIKELAEKNNLELFVTKGSIPSPKKK